MHAAVTATKEWLRTDAVLVHSNKPFQLKIRLLNGSLSDSYFVIEETPQSLAFIPVSAEIIVTFSISTRQLGLQFSRYENTSLVFRLPTVAKLEFFVSHFGKSGILFIGIPDEFERENLAFIRRLKSAETVKLAVVTTEIGAVTALSPIITVGSARELWETHIRENNSQFYVKEVPLRFSFLTWNVANRNPSNDLILDLAKCFRVPAAPVDMVVIALEEIDMSFKSVVTGSSSAGDRWTELLLMAKTLVGDCEYDLVASDSMGGVYCAALVRTDIFPAVKSSQIRTIKLGANGMLANKAAVVFQWSIGEATLAVICCHLAPHDQNWEQRNNQWHELVGDLDDNIDYVVFMGDLNYRIEVTYEKCIEMIRTKNLAELKAHDQLNITHQNDALIGTFYEAPIKFNPTFKFDKNSEAYDTSPKHRVPSWTDRILIKSGTPRFRLGLEDKVSVQTDVAHHYMTRSQLFTTDCNSPMQGFELNWPRRPHCICYRVIPNTFSDHRPVSAVYKFPIPVIVKQRFDELNDLIAAKFDEIKTYSVPSAKTLESTIRFRSCRKTEFTIQSTCLVWVSWKIAKVAETITLSQVEGVLVAEGQCTIGVTFSINFPVDDVIVIEIQGGQKLTLQIVGPSGHDSGNTEESGEV
jgi:endonuclease/exonuclease/phosphatase family metal-dependent hydrolase